MSEGERGSRRHVLSLVGSDRFEELMNAVLDGTGVSLEKPVYQPNSKDSGEWTIRKFTRTHSANWPGFDYEQFDRWWVSDQYRNPQWDLLTTCRIEGRQGLLMVEAKAHVGELDRSGKALEADMSEQSRANHDAISKCIEEGGRDLRRKGLSGVRIDRDTHYQLSNRVATAWKLAECGLPVALLYLGFLGDGEVGNELVDADHWQRVIGAYFDGVLPLDMPGRVLSIGKGSMQLLVRAMPISQLGSASRS